MHSMSSTSSVSSPNDMRAVVRRAWSESVGGPVGGRGLPFETTNRLCVRNKQINRTLVRWGMERERGEDARPSREVAPADDLELLAQE